MKIVVKYCTSWHGIARYCEDFNICKKPADWLVPAMYDMVVFGKDFDINIVGFGRAWLGPVRYGKDFNIMVK